MGVAGQNAQHGATPTCYCCCSGRFPRGMFKKMILCSTFFLLSIMACDYCVVTLSSTVTVQHTKYISHAKDTLRDGSTASNEVIKPAKISLFCYLTAINGYSLPDCRPIPDEEVHCSVQKTPVCALEGIHPQVSSVQVLKFVFKHQGH